MEGGSCQLTAEDPGHVYPWFRKTSVEPLLSSKREALHELFPAKGWRGTILGDAVDNDIN